MGNLGLLHDKQGKPYKTERLNRQLLAGYETEQPPSHILILGIVKALGDLYQGQGKVDDADQMKARAREGQKMNYLLIYSIEQRLFICA